MALTKVTGQVINTSTDVTVGVLTVTNTLAVGGTVSIGGTLTYEDVTNIDSVGLITARNGIVVGSGITLSKDGDVFATGVTTTSSLVSSGAISGTTGTFTGDVDIADTIVHTGDTNTKIRFPAADTVTVETGGTEALRVDSSQRTLIGHNSSLAIGGGDNSPLQVSSTSSVVFGGVRYTNASGGPFLSLSKSRAAAAGSNTIVQDDDELGTILFSGDDGTDLISKGAQISAAVDGTPGSNDMPGRLVFSTTADGASSPTERLRIDSSGRLLLGTTTQGYSGGDDLTISTSGDTGMTIRSGTSNQGTIAFADGTSSSDQYRGFIQYFHNGDLLMFGTSAGNRLKIDSSGHFLPDADSTYNIGSNGVRFANGYFDTLYGDGSNLTGITGTTINNNADNRVITGSGTANTLDGESTLLYDSTTLTLNKGGLTNAQKLVIRGSGNSSGDDLTFNNWGNSDGDYWTIGVNLTADSGGSTAKTDTALRHSGLILDGRMGRIIFSASETSTATRSDSHTFERDGSHYMKGSLYLNGDTAAANALDDYEEGTWTPGINAGITISNIDSTYVKIGRSVTVKFYVSIPGTFGATAGTSTDLQFTGLPFTSASNGYHTGVIDVGNGGKVGAFLRTQSSATNMVVLVSSGSKGTARDHVDGDTIGGGDYIIGSITYQTA